MIANWLARMNQRERILVLSIAALLFVLVNFALWSLLLGLSSGARKDWAARRATRAEQKVYLDEYDMWTKRAAWLKKNQPILSNPAEASSLLTQLKQIAAKYNVQLDNPQIGTVENTKTHQSVSVSIETKSGWEPLVHFFYDTQKPEAFIAFETVNLMVDGNDPTVMHGSFRVAKWFAPGGK
jgi:hypothetical protein